jgi:SAM-dependent methyltransferase
MTETHTTSAAYDQIAAVYAAQAGRRDALAESRRRFAARLALGARVLDVGCGPAHDTAALRELGLCAAGFDRSRGMLAQAAHPPSPALVTASEREFGTLPLLLGDMRCLPIRAGALDGLWVCASFLHIPKRDAPAVLKELRRALRPGGVLFISVKRGRDERWIAHGAGGQRFFAFYQEDELDTLLAAAGFAVREGWLDADQLGRPEPWIVRLAE